MTTTQINILTADGRMNYRPAQPTTTQRIARLERYLAEMAMFNWTQTYQAAERELAELKASPLERWRAQGEAEQVRIAALVTAQETAA